MEIRYFDSAWNDIKNSPGWFGKLALLALVGMIPIFGWIVVAGYMYGWARSIAWGVHSPMPQHIFGEPDDKPYRRGFYALVILFVIGLIPGFVSGFSETIYDSGVSWGAVYGSLVFDILGFALSIVATIFGSICCVRMAIYDRLSAGFQFGRVVSMIRQDTKGAARLLGLSVVAEIIAGVVIFIAVMIGSFVAFATFGVAFFTASATGAVTSTSGAAVASGGLILLVVIGCLVLAFVSIMAALFANLLIVRATGYWVYQFDVPQWGKQDDPMPFERGV
mgnify:FL=1